MQLPLQITFRDIPPSPAVEARIRRKAEKLESYYDRIMDCRVVIDVPQIRHHQGKLFNVRIDITVPGGELVVNRLIPTKTFMSRYAMPSPPLAVSWKIMRATSAAT